VGYSYDDHVALKNVTMQIEKGEVVYLIGENGAGKSTLLMILAALYVPTTGTAKIFGKKLTEKLTKDVEIRKKIGVVFQDPDVQLFSPTVYDDVAFAPRHLGDDANAEKMAETAMRRMNIWHLRDRHPYELSEGEKKRASVATVLSYEPEFILFDEPTANMDVKGRHEFARLLHELKEEGKTMVIATHLLGDIKEATRVLVMQSGEVVYDGAPDVIENDSKLKSLGLL